MNERDLVQLIEQTLKDEEVQNNVTYRNLLEESLQQLSLKSLCI